MLYTRKIISATTTLSENANAPTATPAFKNPHTVRSFFAKGTATGAPAITVQLKVAVAEAGPFAIPLDKAGVPVPALSFAATVAAQFAGPVAPIDTLSEFPWGRFELVQTVGAANYDLTEFSVVKDDEDGEVL